MDDLKKKYFTKNPEEALQSGKFTRRELLEIGAIPFAVKLFVPSAVQLLSQLVTSEARAQSLVNQPIPFININLSGGASLDGNIIPYKRVDGEKAFLSHYKKLGMGLTKGSTGVESKIVTYLGTDFHAESFLLKGLKEVLGEEPNPDIKITSLCVTTTADTFNVVPLRPHFDVAHAVELAGRKGQFFSDLQCYNTNTFFGGTSISAFRGEEPQSRTQVNTLNEIINAVSFSGFLSEKVTSSNTKYDKVSNSQKNSLVSLIKNLAGDQVKNQNSQLKKAYDQVGNLIGGNTSGSFLVNPFNSPNAISAFNLSSTTGSFGQALAASVHSTLNGYASHCQLLFGDYDYHTPRSREAANDKDLAFGRRLGQILKFAISEVKPVFIFVTTDGSNRVDTANQTDMFGGQWISDSQSSLQLMVTYHPDGVIQTDSQIGSYTDDAITDKNTLVGQRDDYVSAAVLANYLSMSGMLDLNRKDFATYLKIAPSTITTDRLHEVVKLFKGQG